MSRFSERVRTQEAGLPAYRFELWPRDDEEATGGWAWTIPSPEQTHSVTLMHGTGGFASREEAVADARRDYERRVSEGRMPEREALEKLARALAEKAERLSRDLEDVNAERSELRQQALELSPLNERLIYAAATRCACGAGMAYDPANEAMAFFKGPSKWECSDIIRFRELTPEEQAAAKAATHTAALPFAFYEVKSENQPSANGMTTRERAIPQPA